MVSSCHRPPPPRAAPGRAFMPRRGPGGFHRCTCPRARKWGDAVLERESLAEPLSGARGAGGTSPSLFWWEVCFVFLILGVPLPPPPHTPIFSD